MEKPIARRVLALEGGSIYALSYIPILENLERHLGTNIASSGQFQILLGTSSGALIAAGIKLGLTATQVKNLFIYDSSPFFVKSKPWNKLFYEYECKGMVEGLEKAMGSLTWNELSQINPEIELVVLLWNVKKKKICFLSTNRPHEEDIDLGKARLADILTTCCAAPYVYPLRSFQENPGEEKHIYWDGGATAFLNPSIFGVVMVDSKKDKEDPIHVVSLGSGNFPGNFTTKQISRWIIIDYIKQAIDVLLSSPAELIDTAFIPYGERMGVQKYLRTSQIREIEPDLAIKPKFRQEIALDFQRGRIFAHMVNDGEVFNIEKFDEATLTRIWREEFGIASQASDKIAEGSPIQTEIQPLISHQIAATWGKRKGFLVSLILLLLLVYGILRGIEFLVTMALS